jgi:hypothetical protein
VVFVMQNALILSGFYCRPEFHLLSHNNQDTKLL